MTSPYSPRSLACARALTLALLLGGTGMVGCPSTDDDDTTADDDDSGDDDDDATADDDDSAGDDDDDSAGDDDDDSAGDDDDSAGDDDDSAGDDDDSAGDDDDSAGDDDDSAGDDDDSAGDDDDSTSSGPVFDCATAPATSPGEVIIPGARGYHGLAFDAAGDIVGSDGNSFIKSDYSGSWSVWVPNIGGTEQITYLPNGDLAYVSGNFGGVGRLSPAGGISLLATQSGLYGLVIGPDNMLWAAGWNGVYRMDQATGAVTFLFTLPSDSPHSVGFSPSGDTLYIGVVGSSNLYSVPLDASANYVPVGTPTVFATGVGGGSGWHDGVGVDACGYIYVPDFWSSRLFRIHPTTGAVNVFADWNAVPGGYGHGAVWGTGVGGWLEDALYVPLPYNGNQVKEVLVGVPRAGWAGTVINVP